MALTLTSINPISPVYTDDLKLTATESTANSLYYYKFDLYIESALSDTFIYFANPIDYTAEINLSLLLYTYFESIVYQPSGNTTHEIIPNSIIPYYLTVTSYNSTGGTVNTTTSPTYYVFNGCINTQDNKLVTDYIMSTGSTGSFLTNWDTDREITFNDKAFLNVLTGDYGTGYISNYGGIKVTRYQLDGTSSSINIPYTGTSKSIVNIDVSPTGINRNTANFIDNNTLYYNIDEINNLNTSSMKINLINEYKLTKFYNFIYVNHIGGLDFFTATKVSSNSYSIDKQVLNRFITQKTYYTDITDETSVLTRPITSYQSDKLKELFMSPAVKVNVNGIYSDIRITNKSIVVQDRYPKVNLIQLGITYQDNNKFYTQQY